MIIGYGKSRIDRITSKWIISICMLFFICVVVVLAYGIGCLGRKRKIGFGWAFAISLFLNPLIGLIVVLCSKEKIEFIDVDKK